MNGDTRAIRYGKHNGARVKYTDEEMKDSISYLTNPTRKGVWCFECEWVFENPISTLAAESLKKSASIQPNNNQKPVELTEWQRDRLIKDAQRLSFIIKLFIKLLKRNQPTETLDEYLQNNSDDEDELVFSLFDMDGLVVQYSKALTYFKNNIYQEGFDGSMLPGKLIKMKTGRVLSVTGPVDVLRASDSGFDGLKRVTSMAHKPEPLEKLGVFLGMIGCAKNSKHFAIFSPEEELLKPYVATVTDLLDVVAGTGTNFRLFKKMLSDYENKNYEGCISTGGLIAEECLTQVYETLSRSPVPQRMTLGALKQKIADITEPKRERNLTRNEVHTLLKSHAATAADDHVLINASCKTLLDYMDSRHKKIDGRLKVIEEDTGGSKLFPLTVKLGIENIIRYRNAVSHKSVDTIGSFEALKSIYCSLSLVMWWDGQRRDIDWRKDKKEIIEQFIKSAQKQDED